MLVFLHISCNQTVAFLDHPVRAYNQNVQCKLFSSAYPLTHSFDTVMQKHLMFISPGDFFRTSRLSISSMVSIVFLCGVVVLSKLYFLYSVVFLLSFHRYTRCAWNLHIVAHGRHNDRFMLRDLATVHWDSE